MRARLTASTTAKAWARESKATWGRGEADLQGVG